MKNQSYSYGNQLNATYNQIRTRSNELIANGADYSLCDILISFLNERINPETGYWGDSLNFAGSNGFFKIITIYNAWGYPYPMPERVTDSVLSNIMGDEIPTSNCCSVYNLWCAICSIRTNVIKTQNEETKAKVIGNINDILRNRGPEAILNTYKKMAPYRKGVAFSGSYESCGGTQQTLYTGLNPTYGVLEGNVDAVCICSTGLTRCMFEAFGFERPSLLTEADWMVYRNILLTNGAAKKTRVLDPNVTFEDDTVPKTVIPYGENELKVENGELIARIDGEDCGVSLIQTARICKGEYKLLEADLSFEDVSGEGKILLATNLKYLGLRPSGFIIISFEGDKVKIENTKWSEGFEYTFDCKSRSFKLSMEFYLDPAEMLACNGKKCSAARVYIDGNYAGKYVNNDGTDPEYPSGIALNNENKISIIGIGDTKATMKMRHFRFAYYG
jgi:hypothetical protein